MQDLPGTTIGQVIGTDALIGMATGTTTTGMTAGGTAMTDAMTTGVEMIGAEVMAEPGVMEIGKGGVMAMAVAVIGEELMDAEGVAMEEIAAATDDVNCT